MPAAAAGAVGSALFLGGASTFVAGVGAIAAYGAVYAGGILLLNAATKALGPKPPKNDSGTRGIGVNYAGTTEPRRMIYGQVRVGGMHTLPGFTSGEHGQLLHQVLTLAGTEVTSIPSVTFDQTSIANTSINASGAVTSGDFRNHAFIRRYIGTSGQTADTMLTEAFSGTWTSNHRGREIAYAAVRFTYDAAVYKTGIPEVKCVVQGRRVYDPRLDSTNGGAGTQRFTDQSTWTYSTNNALCTTDFLTHKYGGGYPFDEVDWALVAAAANVCDETVSVPSGSQSRYTFNGILYTGPDSFQPNLRSMLASFNARCIHRDGKWRMYAGEWMTPEVTIDDGDWIEVRRYSTSLGRENRWNMVRGFYVDPARNYSRVECVPARDVTYEAQDGDERIQIEVENQFCNNEYEMQRYAQLSNRRSRNQCLIIGRLPMRFWRLVAWETVTLNYATAGWVNKTFRVAQAAINHDEGYIDVALGDENEADWADPDVSDYAAPGTVSVPAPSVTVPSVPSGLTAEIYNGAITFRWTRSSPETPDTRYRIIRVPGSASAAQSGTVAWEGSAKDATIAWNFPNSPYWYHVQAYQNSFFSAYEPNTFGVYAVPNFQGEGNNIGDVIPDADFLSGIHASSWWSISGPNQTAIITVGSGGTSNERGKLVVNAASGQLAHIIAPLNPTGTIAPDLYPGEAPVWPGQWVHTTLTFRRLNTLTGSSGVGGQAGFMWIMQAEVRSSDGTELQTTLPTSAERFIRVDTVTAGLWTTRVFSHQVPQTDNYSRVMGQLSVASINLTGGAFEIGRFSMKRM